MLFNNSGNANENSIEKNGGSPLKFIPKIIVADDDCEDNDILTDVLKEVSPEYLIWCFNYPQKAFEFIDSLSIEELPCLIIIDFNMPSENGLELLKKIQALKHFDEIPKIIYSAHLRPPEITACLQAGAKECIIKSVLYKDIKADVLKMLSYCKSKAVKNVG